MASKNPGHRLLVSRVDPLIVLFDFVWNIVVGGRVEFCFRDKRYAHFFEQTSAAAEFFLTVTLPVEGANRSKSFPRYELPSAFTPGCFRSELPCINNRGLALWLREKHGDT